MVRVAAGGGEHLAGRGRPRRDVARVEEGGVLGGGMHGGAGVLPVHRGPLGDGDALGVEGEVHHADRLRHGPGGGGAHGQEQAGQDGQGGSTHGAPPRSATLGLRAAGRSGWPGSPDHPTRGAAGAEPVPSAE